MLNKLENARLKVSTAGTARVVAACVISAGILTGSVMSVNSAPQSSALGQMVLAERSSAALSEFPGLQKAGWRRGAGGPGMLQKLSDEEIKERLTRVVRHVAIEIDATPEQVDEIISIVTPVALQMKATQGEFATVAKDLRQLLLAQEVDRFAIEALRAEKLALADEVSKTFTSMMIEVASVLTPSQREQLDERISELRAMGQGFRRH